MAPLQSQDRPLSLAALRARNGAPKIMTKTVTVTKSVKPIPQSQSRIVSSKSFSSKSVAGSIRTPTPKTKSFSISSRQNSKEPLERVRQEKQDRIKRSSPILSTPTFTSSDEDSEDDQPRKRARVAQPENVDKKRRIRDAQSFSDTGDHTFAMVHARDIANSEIIELSRDKYQAFFTALEGEEEECPMVELQYPSASQREKYQLVKPTDSSDFKPLSEIEDNMKMVAEFYLDDKSANLVTSEEYGTGFVQLLHRQATLGLKGRVGAQTKYIDVVNRYNSLITERQKDGTIAKKLDEMAQVDIKLVEHIIKDQVYARTVSPQVHLVRDYESFSDNVYGELLPKFLSRIFKETHLKSDQVFVDLGSGVGNCVLQAALEIGCESWGCEMMDNPNTLAQLQASEFPARCRLWGIKPGKVNLIHGDFLTNEKIKQTLKRADVVLVNNQAFTAELNDKLKYVFLDLKEGAQIISLKPFRSPTHKIKESNINDPINVLEVVEKDRWSGMVSWTDDPGKWYHQRKDSRALEAFTKKLSHGK